MMHSGQDKTIQQFGYDAFRSIQNNLAIWIGSIQDNTTQFSNLGMMHSGQHNTIQQFGYDAFRSIQNNSAIWIGSIRDNTTQFSNLGMMHSGQYNTIQQVMFIHGLLLKMVQKAPATCKGCRGWIYEIARSATCTTMTQDLFSET